MASYSTDRVHEVYMKKWEEAWFRWFMVVYVLGLSILIICAGIQVHRHGSKLSIVNSRFESVQHINIEANQTDDCKRCIDNDLILRSGIGMVVDPNTTQFPTGITTPCYTSGKDGFSITQPTDLQIVPPSGFPKIPILGNLTIAYPTGFHIPSYSQDCSLSMSQSECLPLDTAFCSETGSPGSIYIHRRSNMGSGLDTTLINLCMCISNIEPAPIPVAASTLFCTQPFTLLSTQSI